MNVATIARLSLVLTGALGCSIDGRTLRATATDGPTATVGPDAGDAGAVTCSGMPPATAIVVGVVDSPARDGSASKYAYAAPGLPLPTFDPVASPGGGPLSFRVNFDPGTPSDPYLAWAGVGFIFQAPRCVDASAYTGIRFTLAGDLGTCDVNFRLDPSNDVMALGGGGLGACTASYCGEPLSGSLSIGTTVLTFDDFFGGVPFPALDPSALIGLAWGFHAPSDGRTAPCKASFTISDVSFVN